MNITAMYKEMLDAMINKDYKKAMSLSDQISALKKEEIARLKQQDNEKKSFAA